MEMRELIDEQTANAVMNTMAVALPLAGAVIGALAGTLARRPVPGALRGLAVGCLGILNWVLWRLYNAIMDQLGLDTVKNLLVNLALFVALGIAGGVAAGLYLRSRQPAPDEETPPAQQA